MTDLVRECPPPLLCASGEAGDDPGPMEDRFVGTKGVP